MAVSITPGSRLGSYEIVARIGAGGMGAVFRARDTRLHRDVAIKILPDLVASDRDRLARFRREAQVLAALNHPNIAQIHGIEDHTTDRGEVHAFVMELVDGEDLARRLERGPIPLEEALSVARQVAEALEAAHEQGIVHRDLKPANVLIRRDGAVKLLDFGIAKTVCAATAAVAGASTTVTAEATAMGVIVGTPAYMAPEQAIGKPVDRRTDIWAFGVLLFEMLCGRLPFPGAHTSEVVAAVLRADPQWDLLPEATPDSIRLLLRRCLARDPRQRLQAIGDARLELADVSIGTPARQTDRRRAPSGAVLAAAAAGIAVVSFASAALLLSRGAVEPQPLTRTALLLPPADVLAPQDLGADVALSPDGRTIVYTATRDGVTQLFRRSLDQLQPVALNGTVGANGPFFSPDGIWVGFGANGKLKKTRLDGSADAEEICATPRLSGASWGDDGTIVFGAGTGPIKRVRATGGTPQPITTAGANDFAHHVPEFLPGGRHVLYHVDRGSTDVIAAVSLADGTTTELLQGTAARYSNGHLIFTRGPQLRAVPFDPASLRVTGDETPLPDRPQSPMPGGAAHFAVSSDRTLVYIPAPLPPLQRIVWLGGSASPEPVAMDPAIYHAMALAPSNDRLAYTMASPDGAYGLWIRDLARRVSTPVSTDPTESAGAAVWSRDGRRLAFSRWQVNRYNLFVRDADVMSPAQRLTDRPSFMLPQFWTPDGTELVFLELAIGPGDVTGDLKVLTVKDRTERVLLQTPEAENNASLSPDGRYMAYQSNESGRWVVYVRPFPAVTAARWPISTGEGGEPLWAPDGKAILYRSGTRILRVPVDVTRGFTAGTPELVAEAPIAGRLSAAEYLYRSRTFDVSRDGKRVIALQDDAAAAQARAPRQIVIVTNWLAPLTGGGR